MKTSVGACFSALLLARQWRGSSSQIVTDGLMAEDIPDRLVAGTFVRQTRETSGDKPRRTVSEQWSSAAGPKLQGSTAESLQWGSGFGGLGGDLIKV